MIYGTRPPVLIPALLHPAGEKYGRASGWKRLAFYHGVAVPWLISPRVCSHRAQPVRCGEEMQGSWTGREEGWRRG